MGAECEESVHIRCSRNGLNEIFFTTLSSGMNIVRVMGGEVVLLTEKTVGGYGLQTDDSK
ncbi:hypothetical protein C5167_040334 [Papaver somniferum]|uniref:Uncharacterized protein n=1 Tax=Papaver somniferum TaxID=3469 RepID=A0A4Y7IIX8_PAPSO|nr:hypothetical protein C5167_040334 [Papaver somniferum]